LTHLALAVLLTGGWSALALGLPAQAISIVVEDEPDAPADAPADDAETSEPEELLEAPAEDTDEPAVDEDELAVDEDELAVDEDELAVDEDELAVDEEDEGIEEDEDELAVDEDELAVDEEDEGIEEDEDELGVDEEELLIEDELGVDEEDLLIEDELGVDEEELVVEEEDSGTADLSIEIAAEIGAQAGGAAVNATASGLMPDSRAVVLVFSSPQVIGQATADADGNMSISANLPADLPPGDHTVVLQVVDSLGTPTDLATGISISADGTLAAVTPNASTKGLVMPKISSNPRVPAYPEVVALDAPAAVVATSVAALTIATVAGVGLGAGGGHRFEGADAKGGPSGGDLDIAVRGRLDELDVVDLPDLPERTGAVVALAEAGGAVARFSPLLSRTLNDATPLRAFFGGFSLLLPIAALLLGIFAAISVGGRAEPAILALMIPLLVIGVFDAFAGLIGALSFALVVAVSGGIVDTSSVRTLIGVGLIMVGPGLIAGSFRDIRRIRATGSSATWERLTDLVVVPLIGGWITVVIVSALPDLGALDFPIVDQARLLGLVALIALVAKVLLEQAAARKVPARMQALSPSNVQEPGNTQQVISALLRTGAFLFIAAAFVGNVWQLWVASLFFLLPSLLSLLAHRFKNFPAIWQAIPDGVPLFVVMLAFGLIVSTILKNSLGDVPGFAQMSFLWLAVPGFALALVGLFGQHPKPGDTRWYTRPSMTMVYRIGGVVMLIIAIVLAIDI
jgi:hypothetical protein